MRLSKETKRRQFFVIFCGFCGSNQSSYRLGIAQAAHLPGVMFASQELIG